MMRGDIRHLMESLRAGGDRWLLLFDIDGTLLDTGGKGISALKGAAEQIFQGESPPLDLAGSTDLGILDRLHEYYGVAACHERTQQFFEVYHRLLQERFNEQSEEEVGVLDGAVEVLEKIRNWNHLHSALLTGNTEQGAWMKLKNYGLDSFFSFGAFGSDRADRNLLGSIAMERAYAHTGHAFTPDRILVIGDTPKDIDCAHAIGAQCLAVATGKFSAVQLREAGSDWTISSLREILI